MITSTMIRSFLAEVTEFAKRVDASGSAGAGRMADLAPRFDRTSSATRIGEGKILAFGKELIDFSSKDYLGVAARLEGRLAALSGSLLSAPRKALGASDQLLELEKQAAALLLAERALTFTSRTQAWLSLLLAFVNSQDTLLSFEDSSLPVDEVSKICGAAHRVISERALGATLEAIPPTRVVICAESVSPCTGLARNLSANIQAFSGKHIIELCLDESLAAARFGLPLELIEAMATLRVLDLSPVLPFSCTLVTGGAALIEALLVRSTVQLRESTLAPYAAQLAQLALSDIIGRSVDVEKINDINGISRSALKFIDRLSCAVVFDSPSTTMTLAAYARCVERGFLPEMVFFEGATGLMRSGIAIHAASCHSQQQVLQAAEVVCGVLPGTELIV